MAYMDSTGSENYNIQVATRMQMKMKTIQYQKAKFWDQVTQVKFLQKPHWYIGIPLFKKPSGYKKHPLVLYGDGEIRQKQ